MRLKVNWKLWRRDTKGRRFRAEPFAGFRVGVTKPTLDARVAKRRARNKAARQSRKRNRR